MLRVPTLLVAMAMLIASLAGAAAERRVALVLANGAYANLPALKNAAGDGRAVAERLQQMGFEVVSGFDLSKDETQATMARFAKVVRGADLALFFYAGHGIQVSHRNYLLPVDAVLEDETSLDFETVSLDFVLRQLSRETKVRLVFLDACRNNPLAGSASGLSNAQQGLAEVQFEDGGSGTLIAFATSPDEVAYDGSGEHSPFATALLEHIGDENVQLTTVMTRITGAVYKATGGRQRPWVNASLIDEVMLNPVAAKEPLIVGTAPDGAAKPEVEAAKAPDGDQVALNQLRALIPKLGSDAPVSFDGPIDFDEPALDGKSIAQLITSKPLFAPVEGLEKPVWDTQCTTCHSWTKATLCEQAKTYQANDVSIMRLPHPLGPRFKVALQKWAEGGCT
jgi:uncharacterized caspase-like protein